jgi:stage II sporulation protein P
VEKTLRTSKFRLKIKKIGIIALSLTVASVAVRASVINLPSLTAFASNVAIISAGVSFPEGGMNLLSQGFSTTTTRVIDVFEPADDEEHTNEKTQISAISNEKEVPIPSGQGKIIRSQFQGGSAPLFIPLANKSFIKNLTKHSFDEVVGMSNAPMDFELKKSNEIQVLIMHTHATEGFEEKISNTYDKSHNSRTTDNNKNIVAAGEIIANELKNAGIGAIHDKTQHDHPSYNGGYNRSAVTVSNYLKKYPSIKIVLDVHRDGIQKDDGTMIAPAVMVNGKSAAQIMIISGCDNGKYNMPNYPKNLAFASKLQQQLEGDYKGITRPILFDYRKYNQDLTTGSLLVEIGSQGNSVDEMKYTGSLIGKSLSKLAK